MTVTSPRYERILLARSRGGRKRNNSGVLSTNSVVASQAAQFVVQFLEPVNVKKHKRQRAGVAKGASQFAVQKFEQVASVVDLRERVNDGADRPIRD